MSGALLPGTPTAAGFRALAASAPWRFTTVHFTHRRQQDGGSTPIGEPVEARLDRCIGRVTVGSAAGVEVAEGAPCSGSVDLVGCGGDGDAGEDGCTPRCGCCPLLDSPASRICEYGPEGPALTGGDLATVYCVHLDVQTGIVVDTTPLDGTAGSSLTNELHAVDEQLDPPPRAGHRASW